MLMNKINHKASLQKKIFFIYLNKNRLKNSDFQILKRFYKMPSSECVNFNNFKYTLLRNYIKLHTLIEAISFFYRKSCSVSKRVN